MNASLFFLIVLGADPAPTRSLTEAMRAAERTSPSLETAGHQADLRAAEALLAVGALMPQASVRASYTRNQYERALTLPQPSGPPLDAKLQLLDQQAAALGVRVPLIDAPRWLELSATGAARQAARDDEAQTRDDVHLAAARAYCAQVDAQAALASASASALAAEARAKLLRSRAAEGSAMEADAVKAEADWTRAKYGVLEARRALAWAQRSLETLTGWPPGPLPAVEWAVTGGGMSPGATTKPSIRAAREQERQLHASLLATDLTLVPRVVADAQMRYSNATGFVGEDWQWAISVTAEWALEPLSVFAAHRGAQAALAAQRARTRGLEQQARDEEALARIDVDLAQAALEQARASLSSARATAAVVEARLDSGSSLELDRLEARAAVADAEALMTESQSRRVLADLALRHASGASLTP